MSKYSKKKRKKKREKNVYVKNIKKIRFSFMLSRNEVFYTFWPCKSLGERIPKKVILRMISVPGNQTQTIHVILSTRKVTGIHVQI